MTERLLAGLARALATRERQVIDPGDKTVAAVLVPLAPVDGELHLLLTRRSHLLSHHRGQVAFPGGRHHAEEDRDLQATALREAHEEIGLEPADARVLGVLDDIETVATRFVITPFVGVVPHPYCWRPSEAEVAAIFTVPLRVLQAPESARQELWDFGGERIPIDTFPVEGHVIWGATQRITRNLLDVIATLA
jgi:8-oxo-dGTP pyrophosphatase MutT (NUDIX family)